MSPSASRSNLLLPVIGIVLNVITVSLLVMMMTGGGDEESADSSDDPEELTALTAYWVENFSVVSPDVKAPFDGATLAMGREAHEMSCMECHATPESAFLGFTVAKLFSPVAGILDSIGFSTLPSSLMMVAPSAP